VTGAARLLEQKSATPETLAHLLWDLLEKPNVREQVQNSLMQWHAPQAAERIAEVMLNAMGIQMPASRRAVSPSAVPPGSSSGIVVNGAKAPGPPLDSRLQLTGALPKQGGHSAFSCEPRVIA
jgi:hypothetical protein